MKIDEEVGRMPRRMCRRRVASFPHCFLFRPACAPEPDAAEVIMTLDEYEALRLSDMEGLYQEQAAETMGVSRQTFGRIVESARRKTAEALVHKRNLRIEGGEVEMGETRTFACLDCGHRWEVPRGSCPVSCPSCSGPNIQRADVEPGYGGMGRGRHRRGCRHGRGR
jgi:predicted DNA-binding protein (UPF0251 family)